MPIPTTQLTLPAVVARWQAARELVEKRDSWLNPPGATEADLKKRTFTALYDERLTWLQMLHAKLDRAVFDAYGWPHDLSDEEILSRLLALNVERAAAPGGAAELERKRSSRPAAGQRLPCLRPEQLTEAPGIATSGIDRQRLERVLASRSGLNASTQMR